MWPTKIKYQLAHNWSTNCYLNIYIPHTWPINVSARCTQFRYIGNTSCRPGLSVFGKRAQVFVSLCSPFGMSCCGWLAVAVVCFIIHIFPLPRAHASGVFICGMTSSLPSSLMHCSHHPYNQAVRHRGWQHPACCTREPWATLRFSTYTCSC